jgi:aminobenzoyl-glutamate utilization protein B
MCGTTHTVEEQIGYHNIIPNKQLSALIIANMREIGAPQYDAKELEFSQTIVQDVTVDEKRAMLRTTKHPQWEKFMEITLSDTIEEPWDEGIVWPPSTDVGDVSWKAPAHEFITTTSAIVDPFHSWRTVAHCGMSIGHKSLIFAAKTIATTALDLLTNSDALKQVQDEFKQRMKGKTYKSPLPPDMKPPHELARKQAESYRKPT